MMDSKLESILGLPNVRVSGLLHESEFIILGLHLLNEGIECPHCQAFTDVINQNRPILVRDLPMCGRHIYLRVPRRQFFCLNCRRYSTEQLEFMETGRNYTRRYEKYIYEKSQKLALQQVSEAEQLEYDRVLRIVRRRSVLQR